MAETQPPLRRLNIDMSEIDLHASSGSSDWLNSLGIDPVDASPDRLPPLPARW